MEIPTKLAVLSACNTGFGKMINGEGVMSLARAFTYAGAESVVMSHWRVDDKSSSTIMQYFYKYLAEGKSKDKALRLAKLQFLEEAHPASQHPFHWNNYVLLGNTSPIGISKWYQSIWLYLILTFTALGIYLLYQKRRKLPY